MKKTLIFGMLLFLGLCGCAETPEKEVVLSKTEGLPEGAAAEKSEEKKKISVPKKWEETISENNGAVTVEAKGVTISVPEVKNTPITYSSFINTSKHHSCKYRNVRNSNSKNSHSYSGNTGKQKVFPSGSFCFLGKCF